MYHKQETEVFFLYKTQLYLIKTCKNVIEVIFKHTKMAADRNYQPCKVKSTKKLD
jgi:hypothetical protein